MFEVMAEFTVVAAVDPGIVTALVVLGGGLIKEALFGGKTEIKSTPPPKEKPRFVNPAEGRYNAPPTSINTAGLMGGGGMPYAPDVRLTALQNLRAKFPSA